MAARAKMKVRIRALHRMSAKLAMVENFESTLARGESFFNASDAAPRPTNASVNSLMPANGIGASAPLRLVDRAFSRSGTKIVTIVRDPEHQLLGCLIGRLLGQDPGFLGSAAIIFWIVEMRDIGHGSSPFLGPTL